MFVLEGGTSVRIKFTISFVNLLFTCLSNSRFMHPSLSSVKVCIDTDGSF